MIFLTMVKNNVEVTSATTASAATTGNNDWATTDLTNVGENVKTNGQES